MEGIIPGLRSSSRFSSAKELHLPAEYDEFLKKFSQGSLLVAFGTTWQPSEKFVKTLVDAA